MAEGFTTISFLTLYPIRTRIRRIIFLLGFFFSSFSGFGGFNHSLCKAGSELESVRERMSRAWCRSEKKYPDKTRGPRADAAVLLRPSVVHVQATIVGQSWEIGLGLAARRWQWAWPSTPTNPGLLEAFIYVLSILSSLAPTAAPHHSTSNGHRRQPEAFASTPHRDHRLSTIAGLPQPRTAIYSLSTSRNPLKRHAIICKPPCTWPRRFDCRGPWLLQLQP